MFSVVINGLKAFSTLHYKGSFIERIAMVQSNRDTRISASDMSEISSDSTKSKQNMDVF